ncbi:MAG: hypothetical protein MRK00_09075 [Nitrosomonas sp.]|nr:hypothetical protein [Nitrosomonas sp.]
MTDSNVFNLNKPEPNDPLQEMLREDARNILIADIELEIAVFVQLHGCLNTDDG